MRAQWIEGCFGATGGDPAGNRGRRGLGYRLYLPPVPRDGRLALLVMLHGCKQNALIFAEGTRMNCLADAHGFGVLYPEQSGAANPLRCWNWFDRATLEGDGEAGLIARLVDYIATRHPIDRARLWVAGMSAGGRYGSHPCCSTCCSFRSVRCAFWRDVPGRPFRHPGAGDLTFGLA